MGLIVVCALWGCSGDSSNNGDAGGPDGSTQNDSSTGGDGATKTDSSADSSVGGDGGQSSTDFPASSIFYQDISNAKVDPNWTTIYDTALAGGWGNNFQLDPSFNINHADANVTPRLEST